jgi:hypothetical protein
MSALLVRVVIGLLLVVHGFAHWNITTAWGTRPTADSWVLGAGASSLGGALWVASLVGFVVAGLALFVFPAAWRPLAVVASLLSLATIGLFWQPQMVLGAAVDVGVLAALLWLGWPSTETVGA